MKHPQPEAPNPKPEPEREWLDATQVAKRISVKSRQSVLRLVRTDPSFPRPVKLHGKHARWSTTSIDRWLSHRVDKVEINNAARIEQALKKVRHG